MKLSWAEFKAIVDAKIILVQYVETDSSYRISAFDGPIVYLTSIHKTNADDASNLTDFEDNYKADANKKLGQAQDPDGAAIVNPKLATDGRRYQSMFAGLTTSKYGGMYCKDANNDDSTIFVHKIYDVAGDEITSSGGEANAVLTVFNFNPSASYDIQGFCLYQKTQPTSNMFLSAVAAYLVPAIYGGSIPSIVGCNLKFAPYGNKEIDWVGDSCSPITYDPDNFTHWHQLKIYHDAGVQHEMMVEVIWYV